MRKTIQEGGGESKEGKEMYDEGEGLRRPGNGNKGLRLRIRARREVNVIA